MQSFTVNLPQPLRAQLQAYQNDSDIDDPQAAMVAALEAYFQTWTPTKKRDPLPTMYDAEDGPCEVMSSFVDPNSSGTCC
ncbi:MAG: hypothetical protein AAFP03_03920 [Cyanobacteria bacterium J06598_3]